jgi:hypothetical protein
MVLTRTVEGTLSLYAKELERKRYRFGNKLRSPERRRLAIEIDRLEKAIAGLKAVLAIELGYESEGSFGWPSRDDRGQFLPSAIGSARDGYHN